MTIRTPAISRDFVRESITDFMDLIAVDPARRYEMSFILGNFGDETLDEVRKFCERYGETDKRAFVDQLLSLDSAGAGGIMGIRIINAYAIAAPAFARLPDDHASVLMWHVLGAMERHMLAEIPLNELSSYQIAAVRGMVVESYAASHCRIETSLDDYAYFGDHLDMIAGIITELKMRFAVDRELINGLTGANETSRPLSQGVL